MVRYSFLPATSYQLPALRRPTSYKLQATSSPRGAVSLAAMVIIGAVILEIGIASAVLVFFLTSGGLGARLSQDAYTAAQTGIQDALIRFTRNKDFCAPASECPSPLPYEVLVGGNLVKVNVRRNVPQASQHTIEAVGQALNKKRLVCAVAEVDTVTGLVTVVEVVEKELTGTPSC